jgi:hypothetical protein
MHTVDRTAPGFRQRAIELHTEQGFQGSDILDLFLEEYGEHAVSKAAFYRWWKAVLSDHTVIQHSAKAAVAIVEVIKAAGGDLDEQLEMITKQKLQAVVLGADPETAQKLLVQVARETNKAKKLRIEREKWEAARQKEDDARQATLKRELAAAGVKRATVEDVVKQVYGIAS